MDFTILNLTLSASSPSWGVFTLHPAQRGYFWKKKILIWGSDLAKFMFNLKGYCTPNLKLAYFVCYLKTINTFLKNYVHILKPIVQETQKWN